MNNLLWVLQISLAVVFAVHGWVYTTWPPAAAAMIEKRQPDSKPLGLPPSLRTFIGICELLAAVGLILPGLTGILPWLTPLASIGLAIVMVGAMVFHLSRQEISTAVISLVLVAICVLVAYGRVSIVPL
jgi:uncharacterized membrane protein YphA (DoxX/SURF4 family)